MFYWLVCGLLWRKSHVLDSSKLETVSSVIRTKSARIGEGSRKDSWESRASNTTKPPRTPAHAGRAGLRDLHGDQGLPDQKPHTYLTT